MARARGALAAAALLLLVCLMAQARAAEPEPEAVAATAAAATGATAAPSSGFLEGASSEDLLFLCLSQAFGSDAAKKVVFPRGPSAAFYEIARTMALGRKVLPAAVVYAYNTADVVAAVQCAATSGFRVSAAGRRHSYQGQSIVSGYVNIDMSNNTAVSIDTDKNIALAGTGNTNALLLAAVGRANIPNLASLIGSCPSVGITGFALGGGQGDLTPFVGLGADQVIGLECVLWNGTVVRADERRNSDLLWATRGGGGGNCVLTQLTIQLHRLPSKDKFTRLQVFYTKEGAVQAMTRLTDWLASRKADRRLGGSGGLSASGAAVFFNGFAGSWREGLDALESAGLLNPAWLAPTPAELRVNWVTQSTAGRVPNGVIIDQLPTYVYVMITNICRNYLLSTDWVAAGKPELAGIGKCDTQAGLDLLIGVLSDPSSFMNIGTEAWLTPTLVTAGGRMVREIPQRCWQALSDGYSIPAQPAPRGSLDEAINLLKAGNRATVAVNHFTHGAVGDIARDRTAYPWRRETSLFEVETGPPSAAAYRTVMESLPGCVGVDLAKASTRAGSLAFPNPETATGEDACISQAIAKFIAAGNKWIDEMNAIMSSRVCGGTGLTTQGYYNYLAAARPDWQSFYFGNNYERLQRIKNKYDPYSRFSKPWTAEVKLS